MVPASVVLSIVGADREPESGYLRAKVAQAAHIPVHLGAMPESVAAVIAHGPQTGETWILNDPFAGGTHLPDVTVVILSPDGATGILARVVAFFSLLYAEVAIAL